MTTTDTLSVIRARLVEFSRQLSHMMSELGGMTKMIDDSMSDARFSAIAEEERRRDLVERANTAFAEARAAEDAGEVDVTDAYCAPDDHDPTWDVIYRGVRLGGEAPVRIVRPTPDDRRDNE